MQPSSSRRCQPGWRFTLTELLLVLGILGVLVSLLIPVLMNASRRAREKDCADNLRQIGVALSVYTDGTDGKFPLTLGQMTTETGDRDTVAVSRASMGALVELLDHHADRLYCPTVWLGSAPDRTGPPAEGYEPGGPLAWGYNKWAGTLNTKPLTARRDYYSRYQDINNLTSATGIGPTHPGYLGMRRVDKAMRRHLILGNSMGGALLWQSAYRPRAIVPLMGPGPIPPSEVVLFGDSNNVGRTAVSTSHSLAYQSASTIVVPPVITGLNELKADGHVTWYDANRGSLYYLTDGEANGGGVFVQDNR